MSAQKPNDGSECVAMTLYGAGIGTTYGLIVMPFDLIIDWKRNKHRGGGVRQTSGLLRMGGKLAGRNVMTWAPPSAMLYGLCCTMYKARERDDWINGELRAVTHSRWFTPRSTSVAIPGAIFGYALVGAMHRPGLAIISAAASGTLHGVLKHFVFGKRG